MKGITSIWITQKKSEENGKERKRRLTQFFPHPFSYPFSYFHPFSSTEKVTLTLIYNDVSWFDVNHDCIRHVFITIQPIPSCFLPCYFRRMNFTPIFELLLLQLLPVNHRLTCSQSDHTHSLNWWLKAFKLVPVSSWKKAMFDLNRILNVDRLMKIFLLCYWGVSCLKRA